MRVAEYLFKRLSDHGVDVTFGIPGDFALPLFAAQEAAGMRTVVMTHEPSVGYAADVYARLRGLGVALVTYGAGALNMVNAVAMAYAEQSPVLVLTGAPEAPFRRPNTLFHHRVKSPESQYRVYQEVTEASAVLHDARMAAFEIDRVLHTIRSRSLPGYIEIARDVVNAELDPHAPSFTPVQPDKSGLDEALDEIAARIKRSRSVLVLAGQEAERFGEMDKLTRLIEKLNLPVATSLIGKSVIPEQHPNFIGNYIGRISEKRVRDAVDNADCILALGISFSDMDTGGFSDVIAPGRMVQATGTMVQVSHHLYPTLSLMDVIDGLLARTDLPRRGSLPEGGSDEQPAPAGPHLTISGIFAALNEFLDKGHIVVADVGDTLFGATELRAGLFIGAGYYASMGLAMPGAIGAQLARPDLRPVVLVGDGAFKMDGVEIATAVENGLNPIVVLVNNGTFATLKIMAGDHPYMNVHPWDYVALVRALGAEGEKTDTRAGFAEALARASACEGPYLIDAVIPSDDVSAALRRIGEKFGANIRKAAGA